MVAEIKAKIDRMFGDTTVPKSTTRDNLNDIREHIDNLLETLGEGDDDED
jgi:hypothetical protein